MIRSAASKVMRLGRATALPVVLAVMLVVVFGVSSPASAHKGYKGLLHLGHSKAVATVTTLVGKVATGSALVVNNPSGGSALGLQVNSGQAPLTVNADAGTATNLDADKVDGKEASDFLGKMEKAADADTLDGINSSGFYQAGSKAADSDKLDGKDSTQFANATHPHSGADITSGTVAEPRIDGSIARDSEMNTALSGKANTTHQHSGADITSGTVAEGRVDGAVTRDSEVMPTVKANDGAGSGVDADTLDSLNSTQFMRFGIYQKSNYYTGAANTSTVAVQACDYGDQVLTGGFYGVTYPETVVVSNFPSGKTGWQVEIRSGSTADSFYAYALCVNQNEG